MNEHESKELRIWVLFVFRDYYPKEADRICFALQNEQKMFSIRSWSTDTLEFKVSITLHSFSIKKVESTVFH